MRISAGRNDELAEARPKLYSPSGADRRFASPPRFDRSFIQARAARHHVLDPLGKEARQHPDRA